MAKNERTPDGRAAVLRLLKRVLEDKQSIDTALDDRALRTLAPRDRAFAHRLTSITLRRLGQTDRIIDTLLDRPLPRRQTDVRHVLRLGVAQLLFAGTPAYAAVDGTVRLARAANLAPYAKLVNAILRHTDRRSEELRTRFPPVPNNTPDWLWQRWRDHFGEDTAAAIAAQHLALPPLDLTPRNTADTWAERLGGTVLPSGSVRLAAPGRVSNLAGYEEGAWWVQDAAASLPIRLLGDVAGAQVLDLCAAPGGKTAQLALAGANVTAVDRSATRLDTLRNNLKRLRLDARCEVADIATYRPAEKQTHILLDAPCSATGTIRRNPDIPWTRRPRDIDAAAAQQAKLLRAAIDILAPGGHLVYAVCSLEPEEGIAQIEVLLETNAKVTRVPIAPDEIGGQAQCITPQGDLRTLPCHFADTGGMDGFFAGRLRRL